MTAKHKGALVLIAQLNSVHVTEIVTAGHQQKMSDIPHGLDSHRLECQHQVQGQTCTLECRVQEQEDMLLVWEDRHASITEKLKEAEEENISMRMEREEFLRSTDFLDGTSADLRVTCCQLHQYAELLACLSGMSICHHSWWHAGPCRVNEFKA